jgi:predicted DNA-binding protein YlxM (UPF0122 family)
MERLRRFSKTSGIYKIQSIVNDNYVKEFKSLKEACDTLGVCRSNIISCIKGTHRVKSVGGYKWQYKVA